MVDVIRFVLIYIICLSTDRDSPDYNDSGCTYEFIGN